MKLIALLNFDQNLHTLSAQQASDWLIDDKLVSTISVDEQSLKNATSHFSAKHDAIRYETERMANKNENSRINGRDAEKFVD